jgi:hypothetical protein
LTTNRAQGHQACRATADLRRFTDTARISATISTAKALALAFDTARPAFTALINLLAALPVTGLDVVCNGSFISL